MYQNLRKSFWWNGMKKDVAEYVARCLTCQKAKIKHQRPPGLLQPLEIPEWKWDSISMDFVFGLPKTRNNHDTIWVIVDRLTKVAHFLPINMKYKLERLVELYVREIVRLHGVPTSVVSDRDPRFTLRFWESLQRALGTKLRLSSTYHPQTDSQTEQTIQSLEDLLRACVLEQQGTWEECLSLVEFTYNNSYHASIEMAPFKALYGRRCRTPLCWYEIKEATLCAPNMVQRQTEQIKMIKEKIKVSLVTRVGIALKFIELLKVLSRIGLAVYQIALPLNLSNLHPVFHVLQLRQYVSDPSHEIDLDPVQVREDLSYDAYPVRIADHCVKQLRGKDISLVKVTLKEKEFKWTKGCEASFLELKIRLTSAPVLALPNLEQKFDVYCDASRIAIDENDIPSDTIMTEMELTFSVLFYFPSSRIHHTLCVYIFPGTVRTPVTLTYLFTYHDHDHLRRPSYWTFERITGAQVTADLGDLYLGSGNDLDSDDIAMIEG
ncbi:uncharacterized protein LOC113857349 [Abrus precatorius]|uniref:Uncharacterized protein LOC113857349 n=1 Tax=Abrus precatorius TaxID=3816 RepID=A0A8B8KNN3_ABRPR|nr:uncharacterized protein LOC113857349 [Abrus precatorius]